MPATLIDGKVLSARIVAECAREAGDLKNRLGRPPGLAVIRVGDDPASAVYVRNKRQRSQEIGFFFRGEELPAEISEPALLERIREVNEDSRVDALLVQLPLPKHLQPEKIIQAIDPAKDADGIHPVNLGKLVIGRPGLVPCTPAGVMEMIRSTGTEMRGRRAVVVGRSTIVGKPMALLLLQADATVTVCHSRTRELDEICREADILVAAVGRAFCISGGWIKPGSTVIDVGMNRGERGLCGDVDFAGARERAGFLTPVPGGVGPMTIAMLLKNTVQACRLREGIPR